MSAYVEILGAVVMPRRTLEDKDLLRIGEFTKENVLKWMNSHTGPGWVGVFPIEDFHAVCGDIDIPWTTKAKPWFEAFERC
jgi:hypothetical protein